MGVKQCNRLNSLQLFRSEIAAEPKVVPRWHHTESYWPSKCYCMSAGTQYHFPATTMLKSFFFPGEVEHATITTGPWNIVPVNKFFFYPFADCHFFMAFHSKETIPGYLWNEKKKHLRENTVSMSFFFPFGYRKSHPETKSAIDICREQHFLMRFFTGWIHVLLRMIEVRFDSIFF